MSNLEKRKYKWWKGVEIYITSEKINLMKTCTSQLPLLEYDVGTTHLLLSDYAVLAHSDVNFADDYTQLIYTE